MRRALAQKRFLFFVLLRFLAAGVSYGKFLVVAVVDLQVFGDQDGQSGGDRRVRGENGQGGGEPSGALAHAINNRFGDLAGFRDAFKNSALGQFGSGWTWLVRTAQGVDIVSTGNAETPLTDGVTPLLTLDVWEHAYYLDYQNKRDAYVNAFLTHLINWDFARRNFKADKEED